MRRAKATADAALLSAALDGLEAQRQRIAAQIQQVRAILAGPRRRKPRAAAGKRKKAGARRPLSAAARKRISMAQKRRWAEYRKREAGAA
jgi:hypothetical protein